MKPVKSIVVKTLQEYQQALTAYNESLVALRICLGLHLDSLPLQLRKCAIADESNKGNCSQINNGQCQKSELVALCSFKEPEKALSAQGEEYTGKWSPQEKPEGWVSVKDRLPYERILAVLVFNGDAPIYNQCVKQATWFSQSLRFKRDSEENYLGTITHWMPLPNPPH